MPFKFEELEIPDVVLITPPRYEDSRGYFLESYKRSEFVKNGISESFVQDNFSSSRKGVVRGLHYQVEPDAQGKLVSVVKGKIFDVAVDMRRESGTFGRWVSAILTADEHNMLWIPEGFAHGFQALENSEVSYKVTSEYSKSSESGVRWDDPLIGVEWPLTDTIVSPKDEQLPNMREQRDLF